LYKRKDAQKCLRIRTKIAFNAMHAESALCPPSLPPSPHEMVILVNTHGIQTKTAKFP